MNELYCIALLPDQEFSQLCLEYKLVAKELFQTKATLSSVAHITLVAPFKADTITIEQIKQDLATIIMQYTEIDLQVNGWNHFEQRTIYLGCKSALQLTQLYNQCQDQVSRFVHLLRQESQFVPHISIVNRDLAKENFTAAWSYFRTQNYPAQTTCSRLVVFKHLSQNWQIDQYLNLVPQVNNNA